MKDLKWAALARVQGWEGPEDESEDQENTHALQN